MFNFIKRIFKTAPAPDYNALLGAGAIILDVRTSEEFRMGHISKSVNIPLQQLKGEMDSLKSKNKSIIAVCRSGTRSGIAVRMLKSGGMQAVNGGSWYGLQAKLNNKN